MTMEFCVGRAAQTSPIHMYQKLEKKGQKWHIHGYVSLFGSIALMAFYTVVTGWIVYYFVQFLTGNSQNLGFSAMIADPGVNVTYLAVTVAMAFGVLCFGLQSGLERVTKYMMLLLLLLMLVLGILLVYLVMVAQFQSLRSPLIVMFTIPLAFTGGFLALLLAGIEVSVVSLVGFVMLVGVIVNNGIVLVDYINQLRLEGMGRREAIIEAGVTRLRPILMTSLTTILGLVVMAFGKDVGTALMQPVALVCIGGLLYATLMTLLVVPCMYDILSRRDLRKVNEEELQLLDL